MATVKTLKKTEKKTQLVKKRVRASSLKNKSFASYSIKKINISNVKELAKANKKKIGITLVVLAVIAFLFYFKSLFVAAIVNGQPVTRFELIQTLEKQQGKKTLSGLITKTLILQEAQRRKVKVSDSEINQELKKIEESLSKEGQKLDVALASQGMTKDDLKERIMLQRVVEKMLAGGISVSDKEVADYIEKNKQALPEGLSEAQIKEQAKSQIKQLKTDEKFKLLLDELQVKAKISIFLNL